MGARGHVGLGWDFPPWSSTCPQSSQGGISPAGDQAILGPHFCCPFLGGRGGG